MNQHPLSAAFPAMPEDQFEAIRDGVIPASAQVLEALIASSWFQSLKKSQRAMYAVSWFHHLEAGSNQYQRRVKTNTTRYAAELAQRAIQEAAHA
jgi:hypothetical protein